MVEILKSLKEQCVDKLTATHGETLQISCNITNGKQMKYIMETHAHAYLGSQYVVARCELLERLTISYQGRGRTDLVDVGKTSDPMSDMGPL